MGRGASLQRLALACALCAALLGPRSAAAAAAADDDDDDDHGSGADLHGGEEVTVGSVLKLQHDKTGFRLHSHEVAYGSGSGQQSVTGFPSGDDSNSYWAVRCVNGDEECRQGDVVENGATIRLQHVATRKWLHSHLHASPLTHNFEVSGYGSDGQSDTGDHWKVETQDKAKLWERGQKVRFMHVDTMAYLHSHDKKYGRPIAGQQEVCGLQVKKADNLWMTAEGVFFPARRRPTSVTS
eukprot:SM000016S01869  [mRNA]  locus=s16:280630:282137:+ [translate_table: standard]